MHHFLRLILLFCVTYSAHVYAAKFDEVDSLSPSDFAIFAKDITGLSSFRPYGHAYSLGITGFEVKAAYAFASVNNRNVYNLAGPNKTISSGMPLSIIALQASKGLPWDFDLGLSLQSFSDVLSYSVDLRNSLLKGNLAVPDVVLRAAYSRVSESNLKSDSYAIDVTVAKDLVILTPYAGAGYVFGNVKSTNQSSYPGLYKVLVGISMSLFILLKIGYEFDMIGSVQSHSLKLSANW